jgi:hypothetical protein
MDSVSVGRDIEFLRSTGMSAREAADYLDKYGTVSGRVVFAASDHSIPVGLNGRMPFHDAAA